MAQTNYWKLGLFVVLGLGLALGALGWLGAAHFERESRRTVSYLDESVQGLELGSPVKIRGVTVGAVKAISFAPDHMRVRIAMNIYVDSMRALGFTQFGSEQHESGPFLPENVRIRLATAGITGLKFLEVDFAPEGEAIPDLGFTPPWAYIPATASTLKSLEDQGMAILASLPGIAETMSSVLQQIDAKLDEVDLPEVQTKTLALFEDLGEVMATLRGKLDQLDVPVMQEEMKRSLVEIRSLSEDVRDVTARWSSDEGPVTKMFGQVEGMAADLRRALEAADMESTMSSVRGAADAVVTGKDDINLVGEELDRTLATLRETLEAVRALAELLERDPGVLLRGKTGGRP